APIADVRAPAGLRAGERRIAELQLQLFQAKKRVERERLLDQIFLAEEHLAPLETALFDRTRRTTGRKPLTLIDLQHALRNDELCVEFALGEPRSYAVIVSHSTARVQQLTGRSIVEAKLKALTDAVREERAIGDPARGLAAVLIDPVRELATFKRV